MHGKVWLLRLLLPDKTITSPFVCFCTHTFQSVMFGPNSAKRQEVFLYIWPITSLSCCLPKIQSQQSGKHPGPPQAS